MRRLLVAAGLVATVGIPAVVQAVIALAAIWGAIKTSGAITAPEKPAKAEAA